MSALSYRHLVSKRSLQLLGLVTICSLGFSSNSYAEEEKAKPLTFSGSATVGTQTRVKGVSITDEKVGYVLNLNLVSDTGLYGSLYALSLDGAGSYGGDDLEVDYIVGYARDAFDISFDAGVGVYVFPGTHGYTFSEWYVSGSKNIQGIDSKLGLMYVPARKSVGDHARTYVHLDLAKAVADYPVTVKAHLGYTSGEDNTLSGPTGKYLDYAIGADYAWKNFVLNTSYIGTDISRSKADVFYDIPNAKRGADIVDGSLVMSLSYSF